MEENTTTARLHGNATKRGGGTTKAWGQINCDSNGTKATRGSWPGGEKSEPTPKGNMTLDEKSGRQIILGRRSAEGMEDLSHVEIKIRPEERPRFVE